MTMEFFKKFRPKEESGIKTDKGFIDRAIEDQKDFEIQPETSLEDTTNELNTDALLNDAKLDPTESFEEIEQEKIIYDKVQELTLRYAELKSLIKLNEVNLELLKGMKDSVSQTVIKTNIKNLDSKQKSETLTSTMKNAEDRMDRLAKKIESKQIEISEATIELGAIQSEIDMISWLLPREEHEKPFNAQDN